MSGNGFFNKVLDVMGFGNGDEYEEVYEEEIETPEPEPRKRKAQLIPIQGNKDADLNTSKDGGNTKVVLQEPVDYENGRSIADHLKAGKAVIINLENCEGEMRQRIIDFVSGTVYAISGSLQKVGNGIILATPPNIDIAGELRDKYFEDQEEVFSWVTKYNRKGDF